MRHMKEVGGLLMGLITGILWAIVIIPVVVWFGGLFSEWPRAFQPSSSLNLLGALVGTIICFLVLRKAEGNVGLGVMAGWIVGYFPTLMLIAPS